MVFQKDLRAEHLLIDYVSALSSGQIGRGCLSGNIMGRSRFQRIFAIPPDHQVPVTDTGIELKFGISQRLVKINHNPGGFLGSDMAGCEVRHDRIVF